MPRCRLQVTGLLSQLEETATHSRGVLEVGVGPLTGMAILCSRCMASLWSTRVSCCQLP